MRESEVEKYLVKVVKSLGGECRKVRWIGRRYAPDRVAMLPSFGRRGMRLLMCERTVWVELKAPGKRPTKAQLREHVRMRKLGQRVEVFDSIEAIDKWASEL